MEEKNTAPIITKSFTQHGIERKKRTDAPMWNMVADVL